MKIDQERPWTAPPAEVTGGFPDSTVIWRTVWEWYLGVYSDEDEVVDGEVVEEDAAVSSELVAVLEDASAPLVERRAAADRAGWALHFVSDALREALAGLLADRSTDGQLRMLAAYSLGRCGAVDLLKVAMEREAEAVTGSGNRGRYYHSTA